MLKDILKERPDIIAKDIEKKISNLQKYMAPLVKEIENTKIIPNYTKAEMASLKMLKQPSVQL